MQQQLNNTVSSFADIAPAIERVEIRGTVIEMRGITMERCFELVAEFPATMGLFSGKIDVQKLMIEMPQAVAAIACESLQKPKDKKEREAFRKLAFGDQAKIISKVLKATMPDGQGPFVEMGETLGYDMAAFRRTSATT